MFKKGYFFGFSLCYTIFYLSLIVLIPLSVLFIYSLSLTYQEMLDILTSARIINAFKVTFSSALIASSIATFFGVIIGWVLIRYDFFGKKIIDSLIDLPFVLPTSIAGITLTAIYSKEGMIGSLFKKFGIDLVYNQTGIILALIFVGIPFIVRSVEPLIKDLDIEVEEAASCLGASNFMIFIKIILPPILPAILAGFSLAFARGIGEFGAVIFIAGNIPNYTEVISLLIYNKIEQYDFATSAFIALITLVISFCILFLVNLLQRNIKNYCYGA